MTDKVFPNKADKSKQFHITVTKKLFLSKAERDFLLQREEMNKNQSDIFGIN